MKWIEKTYLRNIFFLFLFYSYLFTAWSKIITLFSTPVYDSMFSNWSGFRSQVGKKYDLHMVASAPRPRRRRSHPTP